MPEYGSNAPADRRRLFIDLLAANEPCRICGGSGRLVGPGPMGTAVLCVCSPHLPEPAVVQPRRGGQR